MKKVLLVFGTRPEAIKMAPLVKECKNRVNELETLVCVTGQHRQMLDQVLHIFNIKPDFDLNIMSKGQDLFDITSKVLIGLRDVLNSVNPDLLFVHGDTTTSTAASMAAFYKQVPVCHVEAGLRTHNIYSPWPEEMNRQITSRIATYHFAPTEASKQNLLNEGINNKNIFVTGNTVIDSLHWVIEKLSGDPNLENNIINGLTNFGISKENIFLWKERRKLVLITGHRRENFGQGFINICEAIKELGESLKEVDFVYPMHLNPNVREAISKVFKFGNNSGFIENNLKNVYFIEPLDYLPFIYLMNLSYLVLTDSGGIQEEAPGLSKPVLVMRDTTERPEALEAGTVRLVGTDKQRIISEVKSLISDNKEYQAMSNAHNPYGDGKACKRIINILLN